MMTTNQTELSYRRSAIEGASAIGLVVALYDTLAGDLRRAAEALRNHDIEKRCRELNHAALVLGQLEAWLDINNGGELAQNLSSFYSYLRAKMVEAAASQSPKLLDAQIALILQVRSAWQQRDLFVMELPETSTNAMTELPSMAPMLANERVVFSRSA